MERDFILDWFCFADTDLKYAEHGLSMRPQPYEIICYHCQQSAEKYMKGFLFFHGVQPPKTHELDILCEMCEEYDASFYEIRRPCAVLTAYGVQPRYPHEIQMDEHIMRRALEYAGQIKDFEPLQAVRRELEQAANEPPPDSAG
jgi:HEPN domain-containing protein